MFVSIRASHSGNSKETVVAKRMALLVFTDFFCWAPIIFFSLTAAFGWEFAKISLNGAKILTIFFLPLNSCANPFLYAIITRKFKQDCAKLCKRIEEATISLHLSSSAIGRSSTASHRNLHALHNRFKRGSCDILANEASTSAEPSSSSNNTSDESEFTLKKHNLSPEEKQILKYVRCDRSSARPVRLVTDDGTIDRRCHSRVSLVPVRRLRTFPMALEQGVEDDDDSTQDIILHTTEGNVYLSTKSKSQKGLRAKGSIKGQKQKVNDTNTNKCAKRLCNHAKVSLNCVPHSPVGSRTVESQTVESNITSPEDKIEEEKVIRPQSDRNSVLKKFEAERSKQLGLKGDNFTIAANKPLLSNESSHTYKTTATQTDLNFQLPSAQIYNLQRAIAKQEKDKHINEWRKTSHLSFLWRNSGTFDAVSQKQKSNSLVELTRPVAHMQTSSNKRHSLTSKHEGYILLKNTSRDSAYEDDEMYEFYEPRVTSRERKGKKKSSVEYRNAVYDKDFKVKLASKSDKDLSVDSDEVCETSILLTDSLCLPKNRHSCDNESGISSSS